MIPGLDIWESLIIIDMWATNIAAVIIGIWGYRKFAREEELERAREGR